VRLGDKIALEERQRSTCDRMLLMIISLIN